MRVAAKNRAAQKEEREREREKGRLRGVKIMFREHVINRRDENKARTLREKR